MSLLEDLDETSPARERARSFVLPEPPAAPSTRTEARWGHAGLPAVAALSEADVGERGGVIVVAPAGTLPEPLPPALAEGLVELIADRPAIVDLSSVSLASAAPVVGLVGWAAAASHQPGRCCVVCTSAAGRARLRSWHVTHSVAVFGSVGDALQARRYAQEGYGNGWLPDPPPRRGHADLP